MYRHVSRAPLVFAIWSSCAILLYPRAVFTQQVAPDNTAVNARDRAGAAPTADHQKNDRTDIAITRDIRRAIVNDKSLSTYAHNVKVITRHGDVTLTGPVRTEDEKKAVEQKASNVAGDGHVTSKVSVTSTSGKHTKQQS